MCGMIESESGKITGIIKCQSFINLEKQSASKDDYIKAVDYYIETEGIFNAISLVIYDGTPDGHEELENMYDTHFLLNQLAFYKMIEASKKYKQLKRENKI